MAKSGIDSSRSYSYIPIPPVVCMRNGGDFLTVYMSLFSCVQNELTPTPEGGFILRYYM